MNGEEIIDTGVKRFVKVVENLNFPDYRPVVIMGIIAAGLYLMTRRNR